LGFDPQMGQTLSSKASKLVLEPTLTSVQWTTTALSGRSPVACFEIKNSPKYISIPP
jgi:hypothetical protein